MAKQLSYKKTVAETISAKGVLNDYATTITIVEDKSEREIKIQDLLDKFASQAVAITIKAQSDEELELEEEPEEIDIDDLTPDSDED